MHVAFRADASLQIGTGHVMRCLTLADALRERGARCSFVCRAHEGHLSGTIAARGYQALLLPAGSGAAHVRDEAPLAHAHWLGAHWEADAAQTAEALAGQPADWLVVDHYGLDARWERRLRDAARHLMAIDDLADRPHAVELVLDQNLGRAEADYAQRVSSDCTVLVGPAYALLRPAFASLRAASLARREQAPGVRRVLVSMGGVDKDDVTSQVLRALDRCELPPACEVTVVMGPHAPWLGEVRALAAAARRPVELVVNAPELAQMMADADLAIGAAGTTAWERCCLGLPTLTAVLADNQRPGARALADAGAVLLLPEADALERDLPARLAEILAPGRLRQMQAACAAITDGAGAGRVAEAMRHAAH